MPKLPASTQRGTKTLSATEIIDPTLTLADLEEVKQFLPYYYHQMNKKRARLSFEAQELKKAAVTLVEEAKARAAERAINLRTGINHETGRSWSQEDAKNLAKLDEGVAAMKKDAAAMIQDAELKLLDAEIIKGYLKALEFRASFVPAEDGRLNRLMDIENRGALRD